MKLLIVTQSVDMNDPVLGFFHRWIEEFAKHADIDVIANRVGVVALPKNVRVFSLGKEKGATRLLRYVRYQRFLLRLVPQSNGVFFHMCPEYVVGAHILPFIFRKKSALWYAHGYAPLTLKVAIRFVDRVFTSSEKGLRIVSKKVSIIGQGIDTDTFSPHPEAQEKNTILSVSRLSRTKNIHLVLRVCKALKENGIVCKCMIVGSPITADDELYSRELYQYTCDNDLSRVVEWCGSVVQGDLPPYYQRAHVFINLSDTGSLDKTVLEAGACGTTVVTANEAYALWSFHDFFYESRSVQEGEFVNNVVRSVQRAFLQKSSNEFREYIMSAHSLSAWSRKIIDFFQ
jgi:glycosyltransferase involved in cell wall biosynthesis